MLRLRSPSSGPSGSAVTGRDPMTTAEDGRQPRGGCCEVSSETHALCGRPDTRAYEVQGPAAPHGRSLHQSSLRAVSWPLPDDGEVAKARAALDALLTRPRRRMGAPPESLSVHG